MSDRTHRVEVMLPIPKQLLLGGLSAGISSSLADDKTVHRANTDKAEQQQDDEQPRPH